MNGNADFYRKKQLPEKNKYPDIDNSDLDVEIKDIIFEDVGQDITKSANMNEILEELYGRRDKDEAFLKY